MKTVMLLALVGFLLAACATPESSDKAIRNFDSSQPDKSGVMR
jgi:hypothetical protein